jgi:hypothetical protein
MLILQFIMYVFIKVLGKIVNEVMLKDFREAKVFYVGPFSFQLPEGHS